jgi:hypothetical protein
LAEDKNSGLIPEDKYQLIKELTPLPHVDLVFLRKASDGNWETLIFDRKTGPWAGKSCLIGGRQRKGEHIIRTIARQADEVGSRVRVLAPFRLDFPSYIDSSTDQDPEKQATTLVYPVVIAGGTKNEVPDIKSNEVDSPRWVSVNNLPENIIPHHARKISETINRLSFLRNYY